MCKKQSIFEPHKETPTLPFTDDEPPYRVVQNLTERTLRVESDRDVYTSQQVIRFTLPQDGFMNPASVEMAFTLGFDIVLNPTTAQRPFSIPSDVRTVFKRARILLGRTCVLADVTEYGMLCKLMTILTSSSSNALGIDGPLRGNMLENNINNLVPSGRNRLNYHNVNALSDDPVATVPRRYLVKLDLGFLLQNNYIPLHLLQSPIFVELTVEDFNACTFFSTNTYGTTITRATVKVANPELFFTVKDASYEQNAAIVQTLQSKPLVYSYTGVDHCRIPLITTLAQHRLVIPTFRKRIKYALAVMRNESDIQNGYVDPTTTYVSLDPRCGNTGLATTAYYMSENARLTALKTYQWQLGNTYRYPDQPARVCDMPTNGYETGTEPIETIYTGQAPEAFYHLVHTIGLDQGIGINAENMWAYYETGKATATNNTVPLFSNKLNTSVTFGANTTLNNIRSYTSTFVIAGRFSSVGLDGKMEYLDGSSNNDKLTLNLNFNAPYTENAFNTGVPQLHVDVYVFYDAQLKIDKDMTVTLDV